MLCDKITKKSEFNYNFKIKVIPYKPEGFLYKNLCFRIINESSSLIATFTDLLNAWLFPYFIQLNIVYKILKMVI